MSEPLPISMEKAIRIAWDYLEQTSQIDDPEFTGWLLLDTVEHMVSCGERRRLALSNGAIVALSVQPLRSQARENYRSK